MSKAQRIATALVHHEVTLLWDGKRKVLSVDSIVKRYGLDFGDYTYTNRTLDVAGQVVRNALNEEFKRRDLAKVVDSDGKLKRKAGQIQFVAWADQAHKLKGEPEWFQE